MLHAVGLNEGVDNNIFNAIYIDDYRKNKKEALTVWANSFAADKEYQGSQYSTAIEVGSVAFAIAKYVESNPVEMVVMGTMGSTGIRGIFGSNANSVVQKIKVPTLMLPLDSKFSLRPVITLATDFSSHLSDTDVFALNELIKAFQVEKLNVLNVIEGNDWRTNEEGENRIKSLITGAPVEFKYISEGKKTDGIMNFISSSKTDILCVVKHHNNIIYRLFNRSTVNQVMNRSVKAVLVLHE